MWTAPSESACPCLWQHLPGTPEYSASPASCRIRVPGAHRCTQLPGLQGAAAWAVTAARTLKHHGRAREGTSLRPGARRPHQRRRRETGTWPRAAGRAASAGGVGKAQGALVPNAHGRPPRPGRCPRPAGTRERDVNFRLVLLPSLLL